jgi:hypothetical protein
MLIVPEARTAILRTIAVAAFNAACIVGAIHTKRRWGRIFLAVLAVPITLFTLSGILIIWLIMQYGPR